MHSVHMPYTLLRTETGLCHMCTHQRLSVQSGASVEAVLAKMKPFRLDWSEFQNQSLARSIFVGSKLMTMEL